MTADTLHNTAADLDEMGFEILNILEDMERLVQSTRAANPNISDRARVYWLAHIRQAITGPGMSSLRDTVAEIHEEASFVSFSG